MLILVIPFTIGWALIAWSANVYMFIIGRFIVGFAGGAFCVAVPIYISEISESEIRGTLGSYFSLMLAIGIFFAYFIGSFTNLFILTLMCLVVPLVFGIMFIFMPESPTYLISKGKVEQAAKALQKLRGKNFDIQPELKALKTSYATAQANKLPLRKAFCTKAAIKALSLSICLMLLMQTCGINAFVFYSSTIFEEDEKIRRVSTNNAIMILAVMQVIFVLLSTIIIDKLGRRILLLISASLMSLSCLCMGVYKLIAKNAENKIPWLPLLLLCIFMAGFAIGFGPIPWLMIAELSPPTIKGIASAISTAFAWIVAFFVTQSFGIIYEQLGKDWPFWIYGASSAIATIFVYFFIPETKAKTLSQIQHILAGSSNS